MASKFCSGHFFPTLKLYRCTIDGTVVVYEPLLLSFNPITPYTAVPSHCPYCKRQIRMHTTHFYPKLRVVTGSYLEAKVPKQGWVSLLQNASLQSQPYKGNKAHLIPRKPTKK